MTNVYDDSERAWLERRARKIARETGVSLAIARSEEMAEVVRLRQKPRADIVNLDGRRSKPKE